MLSPEKLDELSKQHLEYADLKQKWLQTMAAHGVQTTADFWDYALSRLDADRPFLTEVTTRETYTYRQADALANAIAAWGIYQGFKQKQRIALFMENCPLFVLILLGMGKIGVAISLINTNTRKLILSQAINVVRPAAIISSTALEKYIDEIKPDLPQETRYESLSELVFAPFSLIFFKTAPQINPSCLAKKISAASANGTINNDTKISMQDFLEKAVKYRVTPPPKTCRDLIDTEFSFIHIYTSGTTGPSKAANIPSRRYIGAAATWIEPTKTKNTSNYYICLPLYHGNATAVALAPCILANAHVFMRKKFSASKFWDDVFEFQCTHMVYIGEIWRYIQSTSVCGGYADKYDFSKSPLKVLVGNGLRRTIWEDILPRFHIEQVVEHYGSTEMPGDAFLNWTGIPGYCGFIPNQLKRKDAVILEHDASTGIFKRDPDSTLPVECAPGQPGLLLLEVPHGIYNGYTDPSQTEKKVCRGVFEKSDLWYNTGDLLTCNEDGFYSFVDRAGDSFRCKGENVSANEISTLLCRLPFIVEALVYGVALPHHEGSYGMARVLFATNDPDQNLPYCLSALARYVTDHLPKYAIPHFLRVSLDEEVVKTSTFKYVKEKYVQDGIFLSKENTTSDQIYVLCPQEKKYTLLAEPLLTNIKQGSFRI